MRRSINTVCNATVVRCLKSARLAALVLMLAAPALLLHGEDGQASVKLAPLMAPDLGAGGWQHGDAPVTNFKPNFENPVGELQAGYRRSDARVGVYIGYYRQQNFESKLITSNNMLVISKDKDWSRVSSELVSDDQGLALRAAELRGAVLGNEAESSRLRVWQVYWVGGRFTSSDWRAKLYGAAGRLLGQGDASAVIVIYATKADAGAENALLAAFWHDNREKLGAWLRQIEPSSDGQSQLKSATKFDSQGTLR